MNVVNLRGEAKTGASPKDLINFSFPPVFHVIYMIACPLHLYSFDSNTPCEDIKLKFLHKHTHKNIFPASLSTSINLSQCISLQTLLATSAPLSVICIFFQSFHRLFTYLHSPVASFTLPCLKSVPQMLSSPARAVV